MSDTDTKTATPETARAVRARCEAAGLPAALVERAVRLGAPGRAEARTIATLAAVEAGARTLDRTEGEGGDIRRRLRAWAFGGSGVPEADGFQRASLRRQLEVEVALCYLDLRGVGGRADAQGLATARMPWAATLGSSRYQANDGAAYRDAAQTALWRLSAARARVAGPEKTCDPPGAPLPGWVCDLMGAPRPGWDAQAASTVATAGHLFDSANDRWLEAAIVRAAADPAVGTSVLADAARLLADERVERVIASGLV